MHPSWDPNGPSYQSVFDVVRLAAHKATHKDENENDKRKKKNQDKEKR